MAKNIYGLPYQGSKNQIAEYIINNLPSGNRFVDLFGGGGAITHCASLSNKWQSVLYNDYNPMVVEYFRKAINGEINDYKNRWISREEFEKLKDTDPIIKYIWSFSNNGTGYLFGKQIEGYKKALHYAYLGDFKYWDEIGLPRPTKDLRTFIKENQEAIQKIYVNWYFKEEVKKINPTAEIEEFNSIKDIDEKKKKEELRQILIEARNKSGLTTNEIDKYLEFQGSNHYFANVNSQWVFPTLEKYLKLQEIMELPPYPIDKIRLLQVFNKIKSLESLESLERLGRLGRVENMESLEVEISNISYLDYNHQEGDVVYCDPPYENSTGYSEDIKVSEIEYRSEKAKGRMYKKQITQSFNHKEFYDWVHSRPYPVYFSSYEISDNRFFIVDCKLKRSLMSGGGAGKLQNEFIYCNQDLKIGQLAINF